jgi:hypothetical protein
MAMILVLNMMPGISMAEQMNDMNNHWAAEQIQIAVDGGYVKGYENSFRPNDYITKAEFTTLLNRYFGYSKVGESNFLDVADDKWYSEEIKIADLAGYIVKNDNKLFRPEEQIKREEVVVMLGNIIKIDSQADDHLRKFIDGDNVSPVYREKINAMVGAGYLNGRDGGKLSLDQRITRAEAVTLIYKVASQIYDKKGTYGSTVKREVINQNVLVNTNDVTLKNMEIKGDLYLSAGIGDGDVTLDNVVVMGKTVVEGGGIHSIILNDTVLESVEVNKIGGNVRLLAQNNTNIKNVKLSSGAKLQESLSTSAKGFQKVEVEIVKADQTVNIDGRIEDLSVGTLADEHTMINMTPTTTVMNMEFKRAVQVSKTGNIKKAIIKANGVKLEQKVSSLVMDKTVESAEIQGKKKVNPKREIASSTGGSSSSSGSKKDRDRDRGSSSSGSSDSGNKQPIPQIQLSKVNVASDEFRCYLVDIAVNQSIEQTVQGSVTSADKKKMYFVQPFENTGKGLMFYFGDDIKTTEDIKVTEVKQLPTFKKGIYSTNDGNLLSLETEKIGLEKKAVRFIAGENDTEKVIVAGKYLFSLPGTSSMDTGVLISNETEYIGGLTLNMQDTTSSYSYDDEAVRFSAIAGSKEKFEQLTIENNTIDFGERSLNVTKGIETFAPTAGKLLIKNNTIKGYNFGKDNMRPSNGSSAIAVIERIKLKDGAKEAPSIEILSNEIVNGAYHGIAVNHGDIGQMTIMDNKIKNSGQNGIIISAYAGPNNINVKGNAIDGFGTRKIMSRKSWTDPTIVESNSSEFGIWYQFIDKNYGLKINDKWLNSLEDATKELNKSNTITDKTKNDALDGVLDSTPIGYDREDRNFKNPTLYINLFEKNYKDEIVVKKPLVIYKDTNDNVTYGYDPSHPDKTIKVESLRIIGPGSGKVNIAKNLVVEGDLVIDLPNANLLNSATVKGKTEIKNIKSMDASNADFEIVSGETFTVGEAPLTGLILELKNIINSEDEKLDASKTILSDNIQVLVDGQLLEASQYTIDDNLDRVSIKKVYLDTLKKDAHVSLKYSDKTNKVSLIQSAPIAITITDKTSAEIDFGSEKSVEFTYKDAPAEGVKIYVKNVKDKFGNLVSKEDTVLTNNISIEKYGDSIDSSAIEIDDANDIVTIKKSYLDTLDSTSSAILQSKYGSVYDVVFKDDTHSISEVKDRLEFKIINRSNAVFEFKYGDVFVDGQAPEGGITFAIKDIKNHKGESISAAESNLTDGVVLKVFPNIIKDNEKYPNGTYGLLKSYYEIDDANDTITVKKAYLDTLRLGSMKVENGIFYFTVMYKDPLHYTEIRSPKLSMAVKAVEAPRSTSTLITSKDDAFEVVSNADKHEIKGKNLQITSTMQVGAFTESIKRDNERQQLRVYGSEDISDGKIPAAKKNNYKADYMSLYENDVLLVTAEDGITEALYTIEVKTISQALKDSLTIKDADIIQSIDDKVITLKNKVTISELEQALEVNSGITVSFKTENNKIITNKDTMIGARTKLVVTLNEDSLAFKIVVGGAPVYRALLVGNWDYPGESQDLVGPHNDLDLLEKTMKSSRFDGNTKITSIVKVENRLKNEVFNDIENTFRNAKDNDVSYFYYSGHGSRDKETDTSYLCTVSENKDDFISVHELEQELRKIPGKKIVILDSCNSGGFIDKDFVAKNNDEAKYYNDAIIKSFEGNARDYLNRNNFKVLTASSANEYSYESKVDKLGKFTKALCEGGGLGGQFLADADKDDQVTLMEAYNYLDDAIPATSHIQVYPYNDDFVILGNTSGEDTALKNSTNISAGNKYKIVNDSQRAVVSKDESIHDHIKIKNFLGNILKDHEDQVLEVYPAGTKIDALSNQKKPDVYLATGDLLLVRAEDGTQVFYSIILEAYEDKSKSVLIKASIDYMIHADNGNIASMMEAITSDMTVKDFLSHIVKDHSDQELYVYAEGVDTSDVNLAKGENDTLALEDKLLVVSPNKTTKKLYNIILKVVVKDSSLNVTSTNYTIESPDKEGNFVIKANVDNGGVINVNTSVSVFLSKINKEHSTQNLYVFGKDVDRSNKANAKASDDKMAFDDKLLVVAEDGSERTYTINVNPSSPSIGVGGDKDSSLNVTSTNYTIESPDKEGNFVIKANVDKGGVIDVNTTVSVFLSKINKEHNTQSLYVFGKDVDRSNKANAKASDAKMAFDDKLLVVAEDDSERTYTINVNPVSPSIGDGEDKDSNIKISSTAFSINTRMYMIQSKPMGGQKIDSNLTVDLFLRFITKGHEKQQLYVFAKNTDTSDLSKAKKASDKMAAGDILLVVAEDSTEKQYKIVVESGLFPGFAYKSSASDDKKELSDSPSTTTGASTIMKAIEKN